MTNIDDVPKKHRAIVSLNSDFINIVTCSGYRMIAEDYSQKNEFLSIDENDAEIGKHLREALSLSRFVDPDKDEELDLYLFDQERYREWLDDVNKKFGYKTKKALFHSMVMCHLTLYEGQITIEPWRQESLNGWDREGLRGKEITISENCTDEELGAAARLALSRCTSKFIKK